MEGRELPVGWSSMELNDAGIWGSGGTPSRKNPRYYENGTIPWLVIGDLNDQAVEEFSTSITELGLINSSAKLIPTGSLLVAMYGSIGKLGITTFPCTTNQAIAFCIPNEELVELRYLFHALANAKPELIAKGQGGAQQNISQGILKEHLIPLSPLNEQRRIAAKLDTTLAAVEACRQRLDGVAAILKRFRLAVLAAAAAGELTREWREERGINSEWEDKELSSICLSIADGDHQAPPKADEGIPFITISAINDAVLRVEKATRYVPESYYNGLSETRKAREDDILFSVTGSVGIPALVDSKQRFVFQRHIALLRPNRAKVLPKFLYFRLLSDDINRQCLKVATGTAQLTVSLGSLRSMSFRIPSLQEQAAINERVHDLFTLAVQLEARLTAARKVVDRLTPALLAKAFRGELVPQDPNDEPASVLLERIRAARQVEAASGKPTRPRRRNAQTSITKPTALTYMLTRNNVQANHLSAILKECGPLSAEALWSASQLEIDDFYAQLRDEEAQGFLHENRGDSPHSPRLLEPTA